MSFLSFLAQTLRRRRRRPRASVEVDERLAVRVAGGGVVYQGARREYAGPIPRLSSTNGLNITFSGSFEISLHCVVRHAASVEVDKRLAARVARVVAVVLWLKHVAKIVQFGATADP